MAVIPLRSPVDGRPALRVVHSRPEPMPPLPSPMEAECQPCVEAAGMACAHTGDEAIRANDRDLRLGAWIIAGYLALLAVIVLGLGWWL